MAPGNVVVDNQASRTFVMLGKLGGALYVEHSQEPHRCAAVDERFAGLVVRSKLRRRQHRWSGPGRWRSGCRLYRNTVGGKRAGEPRQLTQARTGADGRFSLRSDATPGSDVVFYLIAKGGDANRSGDNPDIAFLTVLGSSSPAAVTINERTTIASVWTYNQFISGTAIKGHALGLKIIAGNIPSFVDLQTGR